MDSLDEFIEEVVQEAWKIPSGDIPPTVYHYTNSAGLYGIIESKSVFATDSRFMNDSTETKLGLRIAEQVVRAERSRQTTHSSTKCLDEVLEMLEQELLLPNCVFSLSDKSDDLSQWRSYSDDGGGFTIGFDTAQIIEKSDREREFSFGQVTYNKRSFEAAMKKAVSQLVSMAKKFCPDEDDHAAIRSYSNFCMSAISAISCSYKHSAFRSENEWRVNTYHYDMPPVRLSGGGLRPYSPINLGKSEGSLPIKRIGIGPAFKDPAIRYALEALCKQHDIEAEIYYADAPYRRFR